MAFLSNSNPTGRHALHTPCALFYLNIAGLLGFVVVLTQNENLAAQGTPPTTRNYREHEIRIVIPENSKIDAEAAGQVAIRLSEKSKGLVGNWSQPLQGVTLPSVNGKRQPLTGRLSGSILPDEVSETTASYRITTSREQILESKPGEIKVSVRNAQTLVPGAYRGEIPFALKLTPNDVNHTEFVAPDLEWHRLTIVVLKLGRRLYSLRTPSEQSISFGRPWRLDLEIDEFQERGQSLTGPLALDWHVRLRYRQADVEPPDVPAAATEINLADFAMKANETADVDFVPPIEADPRLGPIWKELLFDPSAFTSAQRKTTDTLTAMRPALYNSRTQPGGRGPTSWFDPVIWKAATIQSQTLTEYPASQNERDDVGVVWTRKTISLGFPALDVLGQVWAQVHFTESTATAGNQITSQTEISPGFALFPSTAIVDEPLIFVAATRDVSLRGAAPKFTTTNLLKGASAAGTERPFEMISEEQPRGEGMRFDRIRFSNGVGPSVFPLRSEGQWEVNLVKDSVPTDSPAQQEWAQPSRARVTALCPFPQPMVLFAGKCPVVFDAPLKWFSGAVPREAGCQIAEKGWIVTTHQPLTWSIAPGVTSQLDVLPLAPTRMESLDRFVAAQEPDCDVRIAHSPDFAAPEWQPVTATGPAYELTLVYPEQHQAESQNRPVDVKRLALPSSPEQRNFEYKLPFLMRVRTDHDGIFYRIVTRPIRFRVRMASDYRDLLWIWSGIGSALVLLIVSLVAISIRVSRSDLADAKGQPPLSLSPTDLLEGPEHPAAARTSTPAPPVVPMPEWPVDDGPSIL